MRTSTARSNGYRCPKCGDETTRDGSGAGYVRHIRNPDCDFERGERDEFLPLEPWQISQNRDNGSLRTGVVRLEVGDIIEIRGDGKQRCVTYVMGSAENWYATFKGQGAVPEGTVEWRLVSKRGSGSLTPPAPPPPIESAPPVPPSQPLPTKEGRLHIIKLVLEIAVVAITLIGGIIALFWRSKQ